VRLTVGLGSSTQLAIKLEVAEVRERATVNARAGTSEGNTTTPPINQSEASIGTFFAGTVVTYLPNRDRDVSQFDQLSANAHESDEGEIVDGQRPTALLTQVDGVSFASPLFGSGRAAQEGADARSLFLPQTVIREFQVLSSGVSAEIGGTDAGVVNMATKEGSNRLHGEAFYTVRPATLTSADTFGNKPSDLMNNFGWSDGGAIRKNKLFFYAGVEQDILNAPTFTQFAPQAAGVAVPASLAALQGQIDEHDTPLALSGRIDAVLNAKNTLNLEAAGTRERTSNFGDGSTRTLYAQSLSGNTSGQGLFGRAGLTTVLNARSVNQAVVAWVSEHQGLTPNSAAPEFFIDGFGRRRRLGQPGEDALRDRRNVRQRSGLRAARGEPERALRLQLADRLSQPPSAAVSADLCDRADKVHRHGARAWPVRECAHGAAPRAYADRGPAMGRAVEPAAAASERCHRTDAACAQRPGTVAAARGRGLERDQEDRRPRLGRAL
jgi:hypothetical protein